MYLTMLLAYSNLVMLAYQGMGVFLPWDICVAIATQWLEPMHAFLLAAGLL